MINKNVKIPFSFLKRFIDLLEYWEDIRYYDSSVQLEYDAILFVLRKKILYTEIRDSYLKIVYASNDDERHYARLDFLERKKELEDVPF
jgi:hypothetical protein